MLLLCAARCITNCGSNSAGADPHTRLLAILARSQCHSDCPGSIAINLANSHWPISRTSASRRSDYPAASAVSNPASAAGSLSESGVSNRDRDAERPARCTVRLKQVMGFDCCRDGVHASSNSPRSGPCVGAQPLRRGERSEPQTTTCLTHPVANR